MYTYNHVVYMIMDYLKLASDDSYYTPDHIMFLANKFRAYVLKSKYENSSSEVPDSNYQTVNLDLEVVDRVEGFANEGQYLRSVDSIPDTLDIGTALLSGADLFSGDMCIVSPARFKYVGYNKWMRNISYVTRGNGGKLYFKSCNPMLYYLEKGSYRAVFSDPLEVAALSGEYPLDDNGNLCNPMEVEFPLEDSLLPLMMQYVVKDLTGATYKPKDTENNAADDLSELANFIRTYVKSPLRQQIES